jgi:hypothetical protein
MKIKNTAPGGRGFGVRHVPYEIPAGGTLEIPDEIVKEARLDKSVDGMFADGTFVVETGKSAAKVEEAKPVEPKAEEPKGKPAK